MTGDQWAEAQPDGETIETRFDGRFTCREHGCAMVAVFVGGVRRELFCPLCIGPLVWELDRENGRARAAMGGVDGD